jgi:GNAT superfamily N-acetyltransferase
MTTRPPLPPPAMSSPARPPTHRPAVPTQPGLALPGAAAPAPAIAEDPLLGRIEDAGLNAAQPPEQVLMDGWLVRFSAGAAKRARSVNALALGRRSLPDKLAECERWYRAHNLPPLFRITPFTQPPELDHFLAAQGYALAEPTRVMATPLAEPPSLARPAAWLREIDAAAFAEHVGRLRESTPPQIAAHTRRMTVSPLAPTTTRLVALASGEPLGAGQAIVENELVGLYDIVTAEPMRGRGLGTTLVQALLGAAHARGARFAYLQVGVENESARRIYGRFGFVDRYTYWYRLRPGTRP